jgi:hypothetical protein
LVPQFLVYVLQLWRKMIMAKIFASSLLAASLSLLLIPSAHAFGIKALFNNKVDTADVLDLSDSALFLASALDAQSRDSIANPEQFSVSANPEQFSASTSAVAQEVSGVSPLVAVSTLNQGFESVAGLTAAGWAFQNNSNPGPLATTPTANWGQGVAGNPVNAQAGANASYIFVGADSSAGDADGANGQVSNWLITPELDFSQGGTFSFYTRTFLGNPGLERIDVRLSNAGASTNVGTTPTDVGDFTTSLLTVGSLTAPLVYPGAVSTTNNYQQFTLNIAPTAGTGRIAFNYVGDNGGQNGTSQFVAIDTVSFAPVPEPATVLGTPMALGFVLAGLRNKLKKAKA